MIAMVEPKPALRGGKQLAVKLGGDYLGAELAAGHHPDHIEDLQGKNHDRRSNRDDDGHDGRDQNLEKDLALCCTVHLGSFQDFLRHAFNRCRENHHGIAGLQPNHDHDQENIVPGLQVRRPSLRLAAKATQIAFSMPIWSLLISFTS